MSIQGNYKGLEVYSLELPYYKHAFIAFHFKIYYFYKIIENFFKLICFF